MDLRNLLGHPVWFLCSLVLVVVLRMQKKKKWNPKNCRIELTGKTAIVTGANTGIGKCVAMDFARRKGRVILACRSRERGQKALEDIQRETGNRNVILEILDTSSMTSVRDFADRILHNEKRLDILVNNAGVSGLPHSMTSDGLAITYATNHLGPFLLTNLLVGLMKRSTPSRIVFLSSLMHSHGYIDTTNLYGKNMEKQKMDHSYNCSKLMNIICARELAERLKDSGVAVTSVSPGIVMTEAMRHYNIIFRAIFNIIGFFFFKTAEEGAFSTIFSAVSEEASGVTGKYINSDCLIEIPSEKALDPAVTKKLWEACEAATNVTGEPGK